jgi:hypothetical protein
VFCDFFFIPLITLLKYHCKTPQLERNWGGGEKVENRKILSDLERKSPVENVPTFYMWRESL